MRAVIQQGKQWNADDADDPGSTRIRQKTTSAFCLIRVNLRHPRHPRSIAFYFCTFNSTLLAACSVFFPSRLDSTTNGCSIGWTNGSA